MSSIRLFHGWYYCYECIWFSIIRTTTTYIDCFECFSIEDWRFVWHKWMWFHFCSITLQSGFCDHNINTWFQHSSHYLLKLFVISRDKIKMPYDKIINSFQFQCVSHFWSVIYSKTTTTITAMTESRSSSLSLQWSIYSLFHSNSSTSTSVNRWNEQNSTFWCFRINCESYTSNHTK